MAMVGINDLLAEMKKVGESLQDSQNLALSAEARDAMFSERDLLVTSLVQQLLRQNDTVNEFRRLVLRYMTERQRWEDREKKP
jgi:hypothetical protein